MIRIFLFAESEQIRLLRHQHHIFAVDQPELSLRVPDQIPAVDIRMAQNKGQVSLLQLPRFFAKRFLPAKEHFPLPFGLLPE